jgi:regulator of protease activity HflC (stomatin/prohibitin superfamily)
MNYTNALQRLLGTRVSVPLWVILLNLGILAALLPMTHVQVREAEGRANAYRMEAEQAALNSAVALAQLQRSSETLQRAQHEVATLNSQLQHLTTWYHANKSRIPTATDDELRDIILGPGH